MKVYSEAQVRGFTVEQLLNALCDSAATFGAENKAIVPGLRLTNTSPAASNTLLCRKEIERRLALVPAK